jgi:prolipoprotein diacylglyceryl transferase
MTAVFATFPAPPGSTIGPFNAYGLMIAAGVVAAVWLFGRRLEQAGIGTREDSSGIALFAVIAGVIGARLYHVITDWNRFSDDLGAIPQIWRGGLGIWGGIGLGVPVGLWLAKRRGLPVLESLTCVAPALALAQAIGRWGNWFNQELFGEPTTLPWALQVDDRYIPTGYAVGTTFHPVFLYESLWNLALCVALIWIGDRFVRRPGRLFAWYVAGYTLFRFYLETLRIDPANEVGGLRINLVVSATLFTASVVFIVVDELRHRSEPAEPARAVTPDSDTESDPDSVVDSDAEPLEDVPDESADRQP